MWTLCSAVTVSFYCSIISIERWWHPGTAGCGLLCWVLTSLENSDTDTASSDTDSEEHPDLPEPLTSLFDVTLREHHQSEEFVTWQQSKSKDWYTYRAGRITSTKLHHYHDLTMTDKISKTYLNDIRQYKRTVKCPICAPDLHLSFSLHFMLLLLIAMCRCTYV